MNQQLLQKMIYDNREKTADVTDFGVHKKKHDM